MQRFRLPVVGLVVLLVQGILAGQQPGAALRSARETIGPRLFQVVGSNQRGGSAYLLKVAEDKQGTWAYFATCYHVLHRQSQADLYAADDQTGNAFAEFKAGRGQAFAVPARDLALLRWPVKDAGRHDLVASAAMGTSDGFAFGFPSFQRSHTFDLEVRIMAGEQLAKLLGILTERGERGMALRFLGNEISYPGMSGGPVLDAEQKYAGMLLGRMPEPAGVPVMLPVRQIVEELEKIEQAEAKQAGNGWKPFSSELFQQELPYAETFSKYLAEPYLISDQDWTRFEQWTAALGSDATQFLRRFQEISVDYEVLKSVGRQPGNEMLTFEVADGLVPQGEEAKNHKLQFRLNGKEIVAGERAELLPGENLLIITKQLESSGHFLINDFFRTNPLAAQIRLGGETVFLLKRSLPAIIQRYMVFVTIHNGSLTEKAKEEPYAARLAVRLDYLNRVLNQAPFQLPIQGGDPERGSHYYDLDALASGEYLQLTYVSPQSLDVSMRGEMEVRKLIGRFGGIKAQFPPAKKPAWKYSLKIDGRVQFPAGPSPDQLFFVSPRAHGADSPQPIPLPLLGDDLEVDAGPALREALVCYVNKELLIPDKAALADADSVSKVLEQSGLLSPLGDYSLRPSRIFLAHDDKAAAMRTWVIITFQLLDKNHGIVLPPSVIPLIPSENSAAGIDLEARGLPLSAGRIHLTPAAAKEAPNLLAKRLTSGDQSTTIWADRLHVELPNLDAAMPVRPSQPAQLTAKADELGPFIGELLKTAFRDTPKKLDATLPATALVRLVSQLPLGERLANPDEAQGLLQVGLTAAGNAAQVQVGGEERLRLFWKGPLDFGGARAGGLTFALTKIQLTGSLQKTEVTGHLEGALQADSIALNKDEFIKPKIEFIADINSQNKEQLQLALTATADEWRKPDNSKVAKISRQMKFAVGTGTPAAELRNKVISALLNDIFFKGGGCEPEGDVTKEKVP